MTETPFRDFAPPIRPQSPLRQAITAAYRRPEPECLRRWSRRPDAVAGDCGDASAATARKLVAGAARQAQGHRRRGAGAGIFALEPGRRGADVPRRGAAAHPRHRHARRADPRQDRRRRLDSRISAAGESLFVNAATWGLVVTGKLTATVNDRSLSAALTRLIARGGEPVIRRGVDLAMRMMGEQFVTGETIEEALKRARPLEAQGFRYSYDMLGEAATTAADAARYYARLRGGDPRHRQGLGRARASTRARASRSSSRRCIRATPARRRTG